MTIDGGNSYYRDDIARSQALSQSGIHYVDVGTSGGVWGLERGYCLMIGGPDQIVDRLRPVFEAIAPGVDAAARIRGRDGTPAPSEHAAPPTGSGPRDQLPHPLGGTRLRARRCASRQRMRRSRRA